MANTRNSVLKDTLNNLKAQPNLVDAISIPAPDTKNLSGNDAWKVDEFQRLIAMTSTLKLDNQFYRSGFDAVKELIGLIEKCAKLDLYLTAQIIVYGRTVQGMKTVNHVASAALARFISGQSWAKRFFTTRDSKNNKGGALQRLNDMEAILLIYKALNTGAKGKTIPAAIKKGFASSLESASEYTLLKYKNDLLDVINLVHPNPSLSKAESEVTVGDLKKANLKIKNDKFKFELPAKATDSTLVKVKTLSAIMCGVKLKADTHEVANSEAGQLVAKAIKDGKITEDEGKALFNEQKAQNFGSLLDEGKLGITAALLNINSMLDANLSDAHVDKLCALFTNEGALRKGLIFPFQLDVASEVVNLTHGSGAQSAKARKVINALQKGYEFALPNLSQLMTGSTLVIVDMSASMGTSVYVPSRGGSLPINKTAAMIASKIGATIAKYTNADFIRFGSNAEWVKYNLNDSITTIQKNAYKDMGGTSLACAWDLAAQRGSRYDRVVILSDNECNMRNNATAYKNYVSKLGHPFIYSVDLAAYGTAPVPVMHDKVRYYSGYGFQLFNDIADSSFKPDEHFNNIRAIVI